MEINIRNPGTSSRLSIKLNSTVFLDHTCHEMWGQTILQLISGQPIIRWNIEAMNKSEMKLKLSYQYQLSPVYQKLLSERQTSKIWKRNMCMLVARCGWLANSAALCLISQSFAIFHRHSWCLKKIENKISLSNFKFCLFCLSDYLGLHHIQAWIFTWCLMSLLLFLALEFLSHFSPLLHFSWVFCPYCLSCVSCLHTFSCIVSISLFYLSWSWVIIVGQVKNPQIHNNVVHIGKRLELKM